MGIEVYVQLSVTSYNIITVKLIHLHNTAGLWAVTGQEAV